MKNLTIEQISKLIELEEDFLQESEHIEFSDLKQIDRQLKFYGLELAVGENGAAVNWVIKHQDETVEQAINRLRI